MIGCVCACIAASNWFIVHTDASSPRGEFKMKPRVGIIGLGIMGGAMAEALIAAGYRVSGTDVNPKARQRLKKAGGSVLSLCAKVATGADVVITSLPSVAALDAVAQEITVEFGAKHRSKASLVVIETSTLPIADKERAL